MGTWRLDWTQMHRVAPLPRPTLSQAAGQARAGSGSLEERKKNKELFCFVFLEKSLIQLSRCSQFLQV